MSSHREAPEISKDPVADSTDLYAFVSPSNPDNVVLIANYVPLQVPIGDLPKGGWVGKDVNALVDKTFTPDAAASAVDDGVTADNLKIPYLNQFPYLGTPSGCRPDGEPQPQRGARATRPWCRRRLRDGSAHAIVTVHGGQVTHLAMP